MDDQRKNSDTEGLAAWRSFPQRLESGESVAIRRMFEEYSARLVQVASQHIHPALVKRFDGDDVVQSVFRTFFRRHGEGELQIEHSQQLWRLLVTITICKTRSQARRHTAERRDVLAEVTTDVEFLDRNASPQDALVLWEEIDVALRGLPDKTGEILSLRLEGRHKSEIAKELGISRQTVHRLLNLLEDRLSERLARFTEEDGNGNLGNSL